MDENGDHVTADSERWISAREFADYASSLSFAEGGDYDDIALANVIIIWSPQGRDAHRLPPLKLIERPAGGAEFAAYDRRYASSWGACNDDFNEADEAGRVAMLFSKFVELAIIFSIDANDLHNTFMSIPEYRAALPIDVDPSRQLGSPGSASNAP